ncbi:MAG: FixH family protein [Flavobacteriales bacterium]|nr:FixH family protein [Flavobacteriales bacterium]MBP9080785.1 FixH family protein [Flavobacteriales bacterium]
MKLFTRSLLLLFVLAAFSSCKKDEAEEPAAPAPAGSDLQLLQSATDGTYTLELYNKTGQLLVGHNTVFVRLKNDGSTVSNASLSWMPMMTMDMGGSTHQHSCPYSAITATSTDPTLFQGYVVFNMASSPMGSWEMTLTYDTGSGPHEVVMSVNVLASDSDFKKRYTSSIGTDSVTYLLAMVEPSNPEGGVNDMIVGLYKRVSGTEFPVVDGYTIRVDPRMPGMGNHTAPGNVDLTQGADGFYHGQVGFSMTGYWKINLIVEDGSGTALCGEPVTETNLESSVHFKVSF